MILLEKNLKNKMYKEKGILLNEKIIKHKSRRIKTIKKSLKNNSKPRVKNKSKFVFKKNIILIITALITLIISLFLIYKKYIKKKFHNIPIAFSFSDRYSYPLIVLLTSILYNASPNTFYTFYLLINPDVKEYIIKKIFDLREIYPNCKIEIINMGNKYSNYGTLEFKSVAVYYRLELSDIIKNVDKIIYLDVDTMVHKDLTEMYNIDMGNYYYMGFPDHDLTFRKFNGTRNFINSGVMLINLKKLREVNAPKLFQDYYSKYGSKKEDEYLINAVFYDKIKFLPLEYGIPDFGAGSYLTVSSSDFWRAFGGYVNFTKEDMKRASKNRAITHNCYEHTKWWKRKFRRLTGIGKQWLFYAAKSNVFDDICKKYNQFEHHCERIKNESKYNTFH